MRLFGVLLLTGMACSGLQAKEASCIVIDSDAGLDDFRAVATLAPTNRIVAIVITEGLARSAQGAGAMEAFLARGGWSIRVVPGIVPNPRRNYEADPALGRWRSTSERLNGLLPAPVAPPSSTFGDLVTTMRDATARCDHISLLIIGPWTSFLHYAPEMLDRVDKIVAQGRPYPDEIGGEPSGFNCLYDLDSCKAAFDLLVGRRQRADRKLKTEWVDIPGGPEGCGAASAGIDANGKKVFPFRPTEDWIKDLKRAGKTAAPVAAMLDADHEGWKKTALWDDLTALYLLKPEIFAARGGHLEPCVSPKTVFSLLTTYMSGKQPEE